MAKRKSSNKRLSRYNRSSIRSGFLDPNSEVLGEEEPFWWNNLTNNVNQSLVKNSIINQTSKYLDSDTQAELTDASNGWWNLLESTDSEVSNNIPMVQANQLLDTVPRTTRTILSDSDEEDSRLPPQKRKITIRGKSKRSKSNPFLKAFADSENSKSSKSIQDTTVTKPTNDLSINNESSKESDFLEEHKSKKDDIDVTASTDNSHTTGNILKSRPQVFRKNYKGKRDNIFEELLKSAESKPNETETTAMIHINSSDKLVEGNKVSEESISNVLEENDPNALREHTSQIHSSIKDVSKRSTMNPEIAKNDGNRIYYERSDSSFEMHSDGAEVASQKESSMTENQRNQTANSTRSSNKANNSRVNYGKTESPKNNENNNKPLKPMSHILSLNDSSISQNYAQSKINNSQKSLDIREDENINEENMVQETNIVNVMSQSLSINETSTHSLNISPFKGRKSDLKIDSKNIEASFKDSSDTINDNARNVTTNFENERLTNEHMNATNGHSKALLAKDTVQCKSNNNERLEVEISIPSSKEVSIHDTANFNEENLSKDNNIAGVKESDMDVSMSKHKSQSIIGEQSKILIESETATSKTENFSKNNDKTQLEELNMGASTSKQKLTGIINIGTDNSHQNIYEMKQHRRKTENATNLNKQKRINEYFPPSFSKLNSEINENKEIEKRLEQKKHKLDLYLDRIQVSTQLSKKEIRKKIKELKNEGMKKQSIKTEIHRAYLVNGKRYKRPKLPRPKPWVTDRLYHNLWKVMEPKYKLLTRVESEKFVQRLSNSVSIIIKSKKYEDYKDELDDLLNNMAHLGIIHTRNDFYDFSYQFLPYDFRIKVVPMIMPGNVKNVPYDPKKLNEPLLVE